MADFFQPRNADELKAQFLRDIRLAAIDSGQAEPPTQPGTDWDFLGTAVSNICILGFANLDAADQDRSLLTAQEPALDDIRKAEGLPEVPAAGATGKLVVSIAGATTITNGLNFIYPNGLRGQVTQTYVNPADQSEVNVAAIDVGEGTNLEANETVTFVSPPVNVSSTAKVSIGTPLTGGTDQESPERKRARILNDRRNKPAGGNWAHVRKIALEALGSVQDCYVYPALGGPGSAKVVPVKDFDPDNNDFSRVLPSSGLAVVRSAIQASLPGLQEIVVQAVADEPVDLTIRLTIPDSTLAGGNGRGWLDSPVWPILEVTDGSLVQISAIGSASDVITVTARTVTSPVAGQTHVSWWSNVDQKFYTALVTAASGSSGAWVLTLDRPFVNSNGAAAAIGEFISPGSQNLEKYGATWINLYRTLGPGENTTDSNRIPRAKRRPFVTVEDASDLSTSMLGELSKVYPEITDYQYGYRSKSTPTVPASVVTAPNILTPKNFGIYKI